MVFNEELFEGLIAKARASERLRTNFDLRTTPDDGSQRMLNVLMPGTVVPVHRHPLSSETMIVLKGHLTEVFYNEDGSEAERFDINPSEGTYGVQIPKGMLHTVIVHEVSVIFEGKDGKYVAP